MVSVAGLILAAGKSERMGKPKLMLDFHGKTFLDHIVDEACHSALTEVKVVIGHNAEQVQSRFPNLKGKWIINPDYERGQLSSIQSGLTFFKNYSLDGIMLFLIDHPFISLKLINQLIDYFDVNRHSIVIPSYSRRRGHPVIFPKSLFEDLWNASPDRGASDVVRRHEKQIFHAEVDNPGILIDIDTPEDYSRHVLAAVDKERTGRAFCE
jgi:molybdenum cofactor cytidylyltransferase